MIAGVGQHLWQSTIFAAAAALLAVWLRPHRARVRYGIWLAASVKWLVPFSMLLSLGAKLGWRVAPAGPAGVVAQGLGQAFALNWDAARPGVSAAVAAGGGWEIAWLLTALWIGGSALILGRWILRWRRIAAVVRRATPLIVHDGIGVAVSDTLLEPGVFGVWRPVIVLPEGVAERLTHAELEAVIAHEVCHARRHDNLAAAIHMLVESLFWFHPLVWWLGARLVEERERACDEAVLEMGGEPQVYAESIVKVCEWYLESPLVCVAGVTGSDLKKRMERIMSQRMGSNLTAWKKMVLAGLSAAAVLGPVAVGLLNAPAGRAQGGDDVTGKWTGKATMTRAADGQSRTGPILLNLQQSGTTLMGSAQGDKFETPISSGKIEGDKIHLELGADGIKLDLRLAAGHLVGGGTGSKDGTVMGNLNVDLSRAPAASLDRLGGTWVGSFTNGTMKPSAILHLNQDGKTITGRLGMDEVHMVPIIKGSVDGEQVRLEVNSPENQIAGAFELELRPTGRLVGDFIGADHGNPLKMRLEVSKLND